ncbi:MAG: phosphatase PAP2 family protein [Chlamydiia bacterium]|nr:phosphatase PAP2 family protein [Chlamydiia bacterium]
MDFETLHRLEIPLNRWLHSLGNEWSDAFFRFANLFDRFEFYTLIILMLWLVGRRAASMRLFYLFAGSSTLNTLLKLVFAQPRPLHLEPELGLLYFRSYGIPSGGAMTAGLVIGLTFIFFKQRSLRAIAILWGLMLMITRLGLGAHFASDIVLGFVIGLAEALFYQFYLRPYEYAWPHLSRGQRIALLMLPVILFGLASFARPYLGIYALISLALLTRARAPVPNLDLKKQG